jgi:carbonic anhydrase/acetyltransferase-like protein (isoleucine patch superfamily)
VASGAVVKEGQQVGPLQLVAGVPADVKKELEEAVLNDIRETVEIYKRLSVEYLGAA